MSLMSCLVLDQVFGEKMVDDLLFSGPFALVARVSNRETVSVGCCRLEQASATGRERSRIGQDIASSVAVVD